MGSLATVALAAALLGAAAGGVEPPTEGGAPVEVKVGFYALDFARVTAREESFDLTGYLELSWRDPRLAVATGEATGRTRKLDPSTVWTPRIYFENALEPPRYHVEPMVEADDQGVITSWAILSGKFSSEMDLHRFPFDRHTLPVRIGAYDDATVVRFAVRPDMIRVGDEAFVTDWTIGHADADAGPHQFLPGQNSYGRYEYRVEVARRWTFYVWRVMVPLTLLALIPWAAFWFEPVGLQPQISTCMASLIALVAFNFAIDFALPKVAYLTLIDRHALIGFAFVAASVAVVTLVHRSVTANRIDRAMAIQRAARWAYLPAYLAAAALNLA